MLAGSLPGRRLDSCTCWREMAFQSQGFYFEQGTLGHGELQSPAMVWTRRSEESSRKQALGSNPGQINRVSSRFSPSQTTRCQRSPPQSLRPNTYFSEVTNKFPEVSSLNRIVLLANVRFATQIALKLGGWGSGEEGHLLDYSSISRPAGSSS